jgi:hypothetical protein
LSIIVRFYESKIKLKILDECSEGDYTDQILKASRRQDKIEKNKITDFLRQFIIKSMDKNSKIYVAGHRGLVGSAILRALEKQGFTNLITRTSNEVDLRDYNQTADFLHRKNQNMYSWQQQKWAEFRLIILTEQSFSMTI